MSKPNRASSDEPEQLTNALTTEKRKGELIPAVGFTSLEKNLASLGFFTASTKRARQLKEKKVTLMRRESGSDVVEATATILPSSKYGLPITADQDKYLAFLKIVADIRQKHGSVQNPVGFTSAQLLRLLNMTSAGKNYDEIDEWLNRMTLTGINSLGVVFLAGRRRWAKSLFHVFEKAVSMGDELPDGGVANMNYVWLSDWQLENINQNYLLPIDLDAYTRIRNRIAKTLIPLLQIWLYASQRDGKFVKRYKDLCDVLNVTRYKHLSKIKEKWGPSLNELTRHGYLAGWDVQRTTAGDDFKVVFLHGPRFIKSKKSQADDQPDDPQVAELDGDETTVDEAFTESDLVDELAARGIVRKTAAGLVKEFSDLEEAERFLEWSDLEIARVEPSNGAGFLVYLIREHVAPPNGFLSSRQIGEMKKRDEQERRDAEIQADRLRRYDVYRAREVDKSIANLSKQEYDDAVHSKLEELLVRFPVLRRSPEATRLQAAERAVRSEAEKNLDLLPLDTFTEDRDLESEV